MEGSTRRWSSSGATRCTSRAGHQQGFLYRRGTQVVGYGYAGERAGPIALLRAADFPAVLAHPEGIAAERGLATLDLPVPLINRAAITYLLRRKYRFAVRTFFCMGDEPFGKLDQYVISGTMRTSCSDRGRAAGAVSAPGRPHRAAGRSDGRARQNDAIRPRARASERRGRNGRGRRRTVAEHLVVVLGLPEGALTVDPLPPCARPARVDVELAESAERFDALLSGADAAIVGGSLAPRLAPALRPGGRLRLGAVPFPTAAARRGAGPGRAAARSASPPIAASALGWSASSLEGELSATSTSTRGGPRAAVRRARVNPQNAFGEPGPHDQMFSHRGLLPSLFRPRRSRVRHRTRIVSFCVACLALRARRWPVPPTRRGMPVPAARARSEREARASRR